MSNGPAIVCYGEVDDRQKPPHDLRVYPSGSVHLTRDKPGVFNFAFLRPIALKNPPIVILTSAGLAGDGTQWTNVYVRDVTNTDFRVVGYLNGGNANTTFSFLVLSAG
ncbi:hypothetical protein [Bradyrhizobium sp. STM 3562]|uniref:hypothetical protein n=1 Tax=Bradyrhizobium sp. STM 3562 TaxID=578924 RepID=UPI00388FB9DD